METLALWQGNVPAACQIYHSYWVKQQPSQNDFTVLLRTRGHNRCSARVCVRVCVHGFCAYDPLFLTRLWPQTWALHKFSICPTSETFLPSGLCMFSLSLSFGCYGWSKVKSASWAPPLTIIFIDADVRAIGSAFRSPHRQDRYLKRADATIPASPQTIQSLLSRHPIITPDVQQVSLYMGHSDHLRARSLSIFISFPLFCSFFPHFTHHIVETLVNWCYVIPFGT